METLLILSMFLFQAIGGKAGIGGTAGIGGGVGATCTTVFSDSFPYSNGDLVAVSGGNWTYGVAGSSFNVVSNKVESNDISSTPNNVSWTGTGSPSGANQCATATYSAVGSDEVGVALRKQGGAMTEYEADCYSGGCGASKWVAGSQTIVIAFSGSITSGDVIRFTAIGTSPTVLTIYKNGTVLGTPFTDSSSPITGTGFIGLFGFGVSANTSISNTTGGND